MEKQVELSERSRILALLSDEFRYWARDDEVRENELASLAAIVASGAIANVIAAVVQETSAEEYRKQIDARGEKMPMYPN